RLADSTQSVRIFRGKACPDDAVEPDKSEGAVHAQIDPRVQGGQVRRLERKHDEAEKRAVIGVDTASEVDCRLARDAVDHWLTDENAREPAVEMNADMLAVAEVEGLRRRVEGGRDKLAVGPDDCPLDRRTRKQRDLAGPVTNIELTTRSAYMLRDDLHRATDAAEDVGHLAGKGDREISPLRTGAIHRRLSCGHDRGAGHHPHRRDDHDADSDDLTGNKPGTVPR